MKKLVVTTGLFLTLTLSVSAQTMICDFTSRYTVYMEKELPLMLENNRVSHDGKKAVIYNVSSTMVSSQFKFDRMSNTDKTIYYIYSNNVGDVLAIDINCEMAVLLEGKDVFAEWKSKTVFLSSEIKI